MKLEQQHDQVDWDSKGSSDQVVLGHGPRAQVLQEGKERERIRGSILKFTQDTRYG